MPDSIIDDFRTSAKKYVDEEITTDMLLTKYGLLLKFRAQALSEKEALAEALLDGALRALSLRADPSFKGYISSSDVDSIAKLLSRLEEADSKTLVSGRAPTALAAIGMQYLQRAEEMEDSNTRTDRDRMTRLAQMCLEHAEIFQAIIDKRNEDISTSKTITPAKRISLKAANDGP
jgi:hypothetical protein